MRAIIVIGFAFAVAGAVPATAQQAERPRLPTGYQVKGCTFYDHQRMHERKLVRICDPASTRQMKFFWDHQQRHGGGASSE